MTTSRSNSVKGREYCVEYLQGVIHERMIVYLQAAQKLGGSFCNWPMPQIKIQI